jgi:Rad3-related DNA helicase
MAAAWTTRQDAIDREIEADAGETRVSTPRGRTLVLVGTKSLQSQILGDFADAVDMRGRVNYLCAEYRTCDGANDQDQVCTIAAAHLYTIKQGLRPPAKTCGYVAAIEEAKQAQVVVTNYAFWLSAAKYGRPDVLGNFDLLVCDEGHTAPTWLASACTVELHRAATQSDLDLDMPREYKDVRVWLDWCGVAAKTARRIYDETPKHDTAKRKTLWTYVHELGTLLYMAKDNKVRFVIERTKLGADLKPIWAGPVAEEYLYRGIPSVVLCSATLPPQIGQYLDIPKPAMEYIEVTKGFHPSRRPLIYVPKFRIDRHMDDAMWRDLVRDIDRLIEARLDRKGVIHTRSYEKAATVYRLSKYQHLMVTHDNSRGLTQALDTFKRGRAPLILVSPSVEEGVDFKHDQARWQVILKVPFVDGRPAVLQARHQEDKGYLNYLASLSLIQTAGRICRDGADWGETIIFDRHWEWFRHAGTFTANFKAAWKSRKVEEGLPPAMVEPVTTVEQEAQYRPGRIVF